MRTLLMLVVMVSSVGCAYLSTSSHEKKLIGTYEYKKGDEQLKIVLSRDFFYSDSLSEFLGLDLLLHGFNFSLSAPGPNHAIISERSDELLEEYKDSAALLEEYFFLEEYIKGGLNEHWEWSYQEASKTLYFSGPGLSLFGRTRTFIVNDDGSLSEFGSTTGGLFNSKTKTIPESKRRTLRIIKD